METFHVDFECSMKYETDVAASFFFINGCCNFFLTNIFDVANNDFLCCRSLVYMLQMLFFDVAMDEWTVRG